LPHPWDVLGGNAQSIYLGRRHVVRQPEMDHATCYLNVLRPDPGPILPLQLGEQSFANMPIVCFVRLPVKLRRGRESTYEVGAADDAHNLAIAKTGTRLIRFSSSREATSEIGVSSVTVTTSR